MRTRAIFRAVSPYLGAVGVIVLVAMLLATIYFTWLDLQWLTFLVGVLIAAVLATVSRASRAEWIIARRSAQLASMRDKLSRESVLRARVEKLLATVKTTEHYIDELMLVMLAYVDAKQNYRYHNHAFRSWFGAGSDQIDGHSLRNVLGDEIYSEIQAGVTVALSGGAVRFERSHKTASGAIIRLSEQYVPHFDDRGKVLGFLALITDVTDLKDLTAPSPDLPRDGQSHTQEQALYVDTISEQLTGWENGVEHLKAALEHNDFCLYCQTILPLAPLTVSPPFYEVLIRLNEEEQNLMPPGAFLPLAEQHGLLPTIDRWVVRHLLEWSRGGPARQKAIYSINISGQTISDPDFPEFVGEQLRSLDLPKSMLCFEFTETEALARSADAVRLIRRLRLIGCRIALCGFGRNPVSFDLLKQIPVDYLKIDGKIIFNILSDPVDLAKVKAINRVAHMMRTSTIAELVESEETLAKLRELEVDFAQGFGISLPQPLKELP